MKPMAIVLAAALLAGMFSGCTAKEDKEISEQSVESGTQAESSAAPSQIEEASAPDEQNLAQEQAATAGEPNEAVRLIPGLEGLEPACLMGIKHYGYDMKWMEANQIQSLERYAVEDGAYFLIVPQYQGSTVTVETMVFRDGAFVPDAVTYRKEDTPDHYGLIVNSLMPEGGPTLRVTVAWEGQSASFDFTQGSIPGNMSYPVSGAGYFLVDEAAQPQSSAPDDDGTFLEIPLNGADVRVSHPAEYRYGTGVSLVYHGEAEQVLFTGTVSVPEVSPSRNRFAFISDFEWEVISSVYLYDVATRTATEKLPLPIPSDHTPVQLCWMDDQYLLVIVQYAYGTVTLGGSVMVYDLEENAAYDLFLQEEQSQITSVTVEGNTVVLNVATHDENYESYEMTTITRPLDEVVELVKTHGSVSIGQWL